MNAPRIAAIGTASPPWRFAQSDIADFMVQALGLQGAEARKLRMVYKASAIAFRHTVVPDFGRREGFEFFANTPQLEPQPTTAQRMDWYKAHALPLALQAVRNCLGERTDAQGITHLITVSCTGMYAPGLDIELVLALGLPLHVQRFAINFMGCYAAFNALKTADAICRADASAKVLVVCVELCTLHFHKSNEDDHLLANALFADGAAAALVQPGHLPTSGPSLGLEGFHCTLIPQGKADMAWHIGDLGFEMRLSAYVPQLLKAELREGLAPLLARYGLPLERIAHFAVHPGGKKILQALEAALGIAPEQNHAAYEVLEQHGNMSSATVLFVLHRLLYAGRAEGPVLSLAFGPGLTMEAALLQLYS